MIRSQPNYFELVVVDVIVVDSVVAVALLVVADHIISSCWK